jgi:GTPase
VENHSNQHKASYPSKILSIAIVGRANVGKSTLFNRMVGSKRSLVHDREGVTRDWKSCQGHFYGLPVEMFDTAGLEQKSSPFYHEILQKNLDLIGHVDGVLWVINGQNPGHPEDAKIARWLLRHSKKNPQKNLFLVANQCESLKKTGFILSECYHLGMGEPLLISAKHGLGLGELGNILERLQEELKHSFEQEPSFLPAAFRAGHVFEEDSLVSSLVESRDLDQSKGANAQEPKIHNDGAIYHTRADRSYSAHEKGGGRALEALGQESYSDGSMDFFANAHDQDGNCALKGEEFLEKLEENQEKNGAFDGKENLDPAPLLRCAFIGRPNVGKSTMINRLIQADRLMVSDIAGTTRDSIILPWTYRGRSIELIDTPGVRKRRNIIDALEHQMVQETQRVLERCHVAILLVSAQDPLCQQDLVLAEKMIESGRALVLACNKWDCVQEPKMLLKHLKEQASIRMPQAKGISVIPVSGLKNQGIRSLIHGIFKAEQHWNTQVRTGPLNQWLERALLEHSPPLVRSRRIRIKYVTQLGVRPPTFRFFGNQLDDLPQSYKQYLANSLRSCFQMPGVPLRLVFSTAPNPFRAKSWENSGH